jgi:hypothetical protein
MKWDDYLKQWTYVKTFIKGPTGTGKTFLAASVTHNWRTLYIDVEGGLFSAFPTVKKENIEVRLIRETESSDFFNRLSDAVGEAESGKYEAIVLDSLTEIAGRMEDDYATKSNTGKVEFGDWFDMLGRIKRLCRRLRDCKCHTIVTSLTKPTKQEGGDAIFEPALSGQAAAIVPSMFDTVGLCRRITAKGHSNFVFTTDGPSVYQVRDRYRALLPDEIIGEKTGGQIWTKLENGIRKMSSGGKEEPAAVAAAK